MNNFEKAAEILGRNSAFLNEEKKESYKFPKFEDLHTYSGSGNSKETTYRAILPETKKGNLAPYVDIKYSRGGYFISEFRISDAFGNDAKKEFESFKKGPYLNARVAYKAFRDTFGKYVKSEKLDEAVDEYSEKRLIKDSLPAYFECMLWSTTGENDEPLDDKYDVRDLSDKLKEKSKKDLIAFYELCEKEANEELEKYIDEKGYKHFGHDFWLSRNGHGAGFFDDGYNKLQKLTKKFGEVYIEIGDDKKVHAMIEAEELLPFKRFKVTYHDGDHYTTKARAKSAEDFKKYLTQSGEWKVTHEDEDGKETKKKIVKVEELKESLNEADEKLIFNNPIDAFRWIVKEHQALYVKKINDTDYEGSVDKKRGWTLIDDYSASLVLQVYNKLSEQNKKKLESFKSIENIVHTVLKLINK